MHIETWVWVVTVLSLVGLIAFDLIYQSQHPHEPSFKESALQSMLFIGLAVVFGWFVAQVWGGQYGNEFIAGFITEKSLSVDNLFVFLIIFSQFKVPRRLQSEALLAGIAIALVLRGLFIALGAAAIDAFSWVFYLFGFFLVYTAVMLVWDTFHEAKEDKVPGGLVMKWVRKNFATVDEFHGSKLVIKQDGKRFLTPLLLVMITIGTTDVLFALDSIPAVYGLTDEAYIVFTANAFALLGLRQLYFLLSGLMERLKYLGLGLSIILAWIGVKLVLHAMHENELAFINGGEPIKWAPEISTELSLSVILVTLVVTTALSLFVTRKKKATI
jgi:tellurite resistance protein TerC